MQQSHHYWNIATGDRTGGDCDYHRLSVSNWRYMEEVKEKIAELRRCSYVAEIVRAKQEKGEV